MNRIKTVLLLGLLTGIIIAVGGAIGGRGGLIIALILAAAMNFFSYWYSDKLVLKMYRAREVSPSQAPELYDMVRGLAQNAGLPMPRVYIVDNDTPNAFATGRNPEHAVVAVTTGIMKTLSSRELRGVLGHELAHVKDYDMLVGSVAATLAGAVMVLATMARWSMFFGGSDDDEGGMGMIGLLVMSILAPIAAMMVQMAVSRSREYLADSEGAEIAGDPEALASALNKLSQANQRRPMPAKHPETAHLFIVNPFAGQRMANLFSTHPPMDQRISRLMALAGKSGGRPAPSQAPGMSPPPPPPPPPSGGRDIGGPRVDPPQGGGPRDGGKIDWS